MSDNGETDRNEDQEMHDKHQVVPEGSSLADDKNDVQMSQDDGLEKNEEAKQNAPLEVLTKSDLK